nr:hypothetical protein I302_04881 [Kwoniella bestiolae CBS 10118]OCF25071.1 hypothetical protein I302_04881 [Kwoniella bestiolae CBS 10118]
MRDRLDDLINLLLTGQASTGFLASQQPHPGSPPSPSTTALQAAASIPTSAASCSRTDLSCFNNRVVSPEISSLLSESSTVPTQPSLIVRPHDFQGFMINTMPNSTYLLSSAADTLPSSSVTLLERSCDSQRESLSPTSTPQSVLSTNDRLKRWGTGSHMQFGPTSFWSYAPEASQTSSSSDSISLNPVSDEDTTIDLLPGDWVEWARHLPPDLKITKKVHDTALGLFGAYYAPWCMAADMSAFLRDMELCNLVTREPASRPAPRRTSNYSPLLHNCALHLGVHFNRDVWPELADMMDKLISRHCAGMLIEETDDPNLSTPKALALYAACLNLRNDESAQKSGYIHFGMAFACVQALGVNLKCDHLVASGQITPQDRASRSSSYWTLFQQDVLRAICAGRPFMLRATSDIHLPLIDLAADHELWLSPKPGKTICGYISLRSSVFHWSARLSCLLRQVVEIALSTDTHGANRDFQVTDLLSKLDVWQRDQPLPDPKSHPVPHLLVMHMLYHLTYIYLLRPYFRAPLGITPSAADRCEHAADEISELLKIFDNLHGLSNAVASVIPVIFGMATIRLLILASDSTCSMADGANSLDECIGHMDTIAHTWIEARQALEVIKHLKKEWLPYSNPTGCGAGQTSASSIGDMGGEGDDCDSIGGMAVVNEILQWMSVNGSIDVSSFNLAQRF